MLQVLEDLACMQLILSCHSNQGRQAIWENMAARSVVRTRVSTVQAEREHPLLLERPSLVSSQTTAHVFSECFSELLGSRDLPWDAKSVSNLALSRTGNRLQHNNRLAEDLKEVSASYLADCD